MSNHNWQVGETYKTRGGREAKVLSTDGPNSHPIVVKHKNDVLRTHHHNGQFWSTRISDNDLIPPKREMFGVYPIENLWKVFDTKEEAIAAAQTNIPGTKIIRFVEDGEVKDE